MTEKILGLLGAVLCSAPLIVGASEARPMNISIWAPGMEEPQEFDSSDGQLEFVLDERCWAYVIKGMTGSITLGDENEEGEFFSLVDNNNDGGWGGQSSWASVGLGVNGSPLLDPEMFFSVTGDQPGASSDFTIASLEEWYVLQADSDGQLSIAFTPMINDALFPSGEGVVNVNPTVNLTLFADIYRNPPETSGDLRTSGLLASRTGRVTLSWDFTRGAEIPSSSGLLASLK